MNVQSSSNILINATRVSTRNIAALYEFLLDETLSVIECVKVESLAEGIVSPVEHYLQSLEGTLFELNHVRINPSLDNTFVIHCLIEALEKIGAGVKNPPDQNSMATCFKPLGEITQNVRFYFDKGGQCVFLCPKAKLSVLPGNLPDNVHPLTPKRRPKPR